jgi:LysR family transcriptional regulator, low CO2-responsive transcriptional regulator
MTPTQARAFLAVALKGSFSKAAQSLGVSQPTVTNQIKQIEQRYQVELFHRRPRGASLTPVGETLLPSVQRMFGSFEEASTYLEQVRGMQRGHLRVGSYGPYDVMKVVARYGARFPAVSIAVDFSNSQILAERLINYELDVAVLGRIKSQPAFHTLPFRKPPLVVIAPRTSRWASMNSVSVKDLKDETMICREPGSAARVAHDRLFEKAKISPRRSFQFGSREGVVSAVAEGVGLGTIFDEGILPEDRVVKLMIAGAAVVSRVDVVCLSERQTNQLIAGFFTVAREILLE